MRPSRFQYLVWLLQASWSATQLRRNIPSHVDSRSSIAWLLLLPCHMSQRQMSMRQSQNFHNKSIPSSLLSCLDYQGHGSAMVACWLHSVPVPLMQEFFPAPFYRSVCPGNSGCCGGSGGAPRGFRRSWWIGEALSGYS